MTDTMRTIPRLLLPIMLAAAIALTAAGCGNDSDDANSSAAATSATAGSDEAITKDAATDEGDAMKDDGKAMKDDGKAMKSDSAMSAKGATVKVGKTEYGKILQDAKGRTLYLFTKERSNKSECYDDCARAWPPLITKGKPAAGVGARKSKLGTTKRNDGKLQVTYNGHPLYYYVDEDEPNEVLCQAVPEFGGIWYVVNSAGNAITKK